MTANQDPILLEEAPSPVSAASVVRTQRLTVVLSFISIYLIWGSTYLAIRYAVETIPPLYTPGIRHLTAGAALSLLAGSVQLLLAGTVAGEYRGFSIASVSPRSWLALGYLILFGSVVAFTAYNWLLERYSPTLVATHTYVNPIVAVLLGWLLAGEAVTLNVLLATAMIIGAVILVDRGTTLLKKGA